jgi:hypothetical protein
MMETELVSETLVFILTLTRLITREKFVVVQSQFESSLKIWWRSDYYQENQRIIPISFSELHEIKN